MPNLENAPTEEQISADHSEAKRIDLAQDLRALAEQEQSEHPIASEKLLESVDMIEQKGDRMNEANIDEARANVAAALEKSEPSQEAA